MARFSFLHRIPFCLLIQAQPNADKQPNQYFLYICKTYQIQPGQRNILLNIKNMINRGPVKPKHRAILKKLLDRESTYIMSDETKDKLIDIGETVEYGAGELFAAESEIERDIYILIDGVIREWYWDGNDERTTYFASPATVCISYRGFLLDLPSTVNHEACTKSLLMQIKKSDFNSFILQTPEFMRWMLYASFMQLALFEKKYGVIQGKAKERYLQFVKNRPEIIKHAKLKTIASYLNITPQYLSKIRSKIHR